MTDRDLLKEIQLTEEKLIHNQDPSLVVYLFVLFYFKNERGI